MIADLDRRVGLLNSDIASEEKRVRVSDPSNFAYPIHARTMAARRDNLRVTIAALDQRQEQAVPITLSPVIFDLTLHPTLLSRA